MPESTSKMKILLLQLRKRDWERQQLERIPSKNSLTEAIFCVLRVGVSVLQPTEFASLMCSEESQLNGLHRLNWLEKWRLHFSVCNAVMTPNPHTWIQLWPKQPRWLNESKTTTEQNCTSKNPPSVIVQHAVQQLKKPPFPISVKRTKVEIKAVHLSFGRTQVDVGSIESRQHDSCKPAN